MMVCSLGDPLEVLPRLLDIIYAKFGDGKNEKGFRILDKHVRLIQGDGINMASIKAILKVIEEAGYASNNLVFGSGGQLFQLSYFSHIRIFQVVSYKNSIVIQ